MVRALVVGVLGAVVLTGCIVGDTGDARYIADEAATLEGVLLTTQSGSAQYWFEYGTTTSYGQETTRLTTPVYEGERTAVSVVVEGLQPATIYHYRLCGHDPHGICGADRTLTTGSGRESVFGEADAIGDGYGASAAVSAAADPGGVGYLDGDAWGGGYFTGPPPNFGRIFWGGGGPVWCLRVEGNLAVVGYSFSDDILGLTRAALVIQDNGPTGDRFDILLLDGTAACPQPDAALIGTGAVVEGTPTSGDFDVDDG